jgi:hypothetical protein
MTRNRLAVASSIRYCVLALPIYLVTVSILWFAGCGILSGEKVTPEAVAAIQARQQAADAAIQKQQALIQAQIDAAKAKGDIEGAANAEKNLAVVTKAREFLSKGTNTVNLILRPDGTIDLTPVAGLLATVPGGGWAALGVGALGIIVREYQNRNKLASAKSNTSEAENALAALWNATPEGPGLSDSLSPNVLSKIHAVDAKLSKVP